MSNKLAELRARIQADQEKAKSYGKKNTTDSANYKFWDIPDGDSATVRFLPNGAESGDFWIDKYMIKLPFAGVRGKNTNQTIVTVPCMVMYGEKCPIQEEIKPLWKTDEDTARIYYKKKSTIFHGFVRKNGVKDDVTPENPIRRFGINAKLTKSIIAGCMDPEMEDMPTDFLNGTDFIIKKTTQGKWADYSTSVFSRKSTALTDEEVAALEAFPLPDLSTYLPKKPDDEHLAIIMEMFVDSMNGDAYDLEKYGKYYKPFGIDDAAEGEAKSATAGSGTHTTVSTKSVAEESEDVSEDTEAEEVAVERPAAVRTATPAASAGTGQKQSVQDLLQTLKNKKK